MTAGDGDVDPWRNFPEVTVKDGEKNIYDHLADHVESFKENSASTLSTVGWWLVTPLTFVLSRASCGVCSAPRTSASKVWDTANLGWWDFQRRRVKSIVLAKTIYSRIKDAVKKWDELEAIGQEKEANDQWIDACKVSAVEIRVHAEECKGLFVKATQQMSTMTGIVDDACLEEFRKTTEALPVSAPEEVYRVIQRSLERSPRELFAAFDREPVASASIGQVHKAIVRLPDGNTHLVAVKVQHDGVDQVFSEDLGTLGEISRLVAYWAPQLNFTKVVQEFEEVIPRELNFLEEAEALMRANRVLKKSNSPVIVPAVLPDFCSKEVLVMDFVEAIPFLQLSDAAYCERMQLDKTVIMMELLNSFALLVFKEGLIHGDPHSGNIRLQLNRNAAGGAVAVIFDWGMTKSLSSEDRLSLGLFFHSLANMDLNGILEALDFLGFRFNTEMLTDELVEEVFGRLRAVMKDTVSKEQTQANTKNAYKEFKERKLEIEGSGLDLSRGDPTKILQSFPSCIVFFLRMCECMRGLCVAVHAEDLPILEIFSSHARTAFKDASREQALINSTNVFGGLRRQSSKEASMDNLQASTIQDGIHLGLRRISSGPSSKANNGFLDSGAQIKPISANGAQRLASDTQRNVPAKSRLEQTVKKCVEALKAEGKVIGAQVAVMQGAKLTCEVAVGTISTIDMRPVDRGTRFPLLGASIGMATLGLLRTLRNENSSSPEKVLNMRLSELWEAFAGGECQFTLREFLSHRIGLQNAFPLDFSPMSLNDPMRVQKHLEAVELTTTRDARYSYILQTFVLAKLAQEFAPSKTLQSWIRSAMQVKELDIGAPGHNCAVVCRDLPSLSRVSMIEVENARVKRKSRSIASMLFKNTKEASSESFSLVEACTKNPLTFDPLQANVMKISGDMPFRAGLCLSASAVGLAATLRGKDVHADLDSLRALEPSSDDGSAVGWFLTGGATRFSSGGLQILELVPLGCKAFYSKPELGFGIVCGMGPCVMHFPSLGQGGLTIAVTVNNVLHGRDVAATVASEILGQYGFRPRWTRMPLRVMAEIARMAKQNSMLLPVLQVARASGKVDEEKEAGCIPKRMSCHQSAGVCYPSKGVAENSAPRNEA